MGGCGQEYVMWMLCDGLAFVIDYDLHKYAKLQPDKSSQSVKVVTDGLQGDVSEKEMPRINVYNLVR